MATLAKSANYIAADDPDRLLSESEAAILRGQSVYTLQAERCRGVGCVYVKIGSSVRYRRADVVAFIKAHLVRPDSSKSKPSRDRPSNQTGA
jgi:hypothetical protein